VTDRVSRALAAAIAVAGAHGLTTADPVLLHDGVNVVVHLRPAPVVARVATLTPLLRPRIDRPFGREVALATALAAAGAPVIPPSDELPPGPHQHDGLTLSFWRYVQVLPEPPTAVEAGRTLAQLHAVLADSGANIAADGAAERGWGDPLDTPLDDLAVFAARGRRLGAPADLVERSTELTERLRPRLTGPAMVLHGDAHPGNLLVTADGLRWTDLEDTCRGPRAWDLASLRTTGRLDGRAALDAMPDPVPDEELAPFRWLRLLYTGAWWFVHAAREPGHLPEARQRLQAAVEEVSAGLAAGRRGRA
jgi:hypothetical protein